jgi:hypothetical protein
MVKSMKYRFAFLGTLGVVAASGALLACNGLLGIGVASQEQEDSGVDAGPLPVTCESYCTLMDKNCNWSTPYGEYISKDTCLKMCTFDNNGMLGGTDDNVGCRMKYALLAGEDGGAAVNCRKAGLLGGYGVCGTPLTACTEFCNADVPFCQEAGVPSYNTTDDCVNICMGTFDAGAGDAGAADAFGPYVYVNDGGPELSNSETGNTLNCRTWHMNNAYTNGAITHCPHTSLKSGPCKNH